MPFLSPVPNFLFNVDLAFRRHLLLYVLLMVSWILSIVTMRFLEYRKPCISALWLYIETNLFILGAILYVKIRRMDNLGGMAPEPLLDEWDDEDDDDDWVFLIEEPQMEWYEDFYGADGVGIFMEPDGRKVKVPFGSGEMNWAHEKEKDK